MEVTNTLQPDLGCLLDRCGHIFTHRFGRRKKRREQLLAIIADQPGVTQKELAEKLEIQPASASELLMKLERRGLIRREKNQDDRRSICVHLTDAGVQALNQPAGDSPDPFAALSAQEQAQLHELLEKLLLDWQQRFPRERCCSESDDRKEAST